MLYSVLKPFVEVSLRAFFRKIEVIGKENLEVKGPIIFVSNHPNAFLDPLVLVISQKPELYFIAGAEWFGKGLKNRVFRNDFNMIPVIRPWLKKGGEKVPVSNDEMFEQCYKSLAEDKRITIYPEGTSVTVSKIRELKTGTARIKVGADNYFKKQGLNKEVSIIPVGVNYYNPRTFQSDVILNVGKPIDFSDIQEEDPKEQVQKMTLRIHEKMSELVFHFEKENFRDLAKKVYKLYAPAVLGSDNKDLVEDYKLQKGILDATHHYWEKDPGSLKSIEEKVNSLDEKIEKHKIDLRYFGEYRFPVFLFLRLLLGLPFFLGGWIINFLPYKLTRWIFERFLRPKFSTTYEPGKLNPSFLGSMAFLLGMVLFTLWYILLNILAIGLTGAYWLIPVIFIGGYTLGRYAARYARLVFDFIQQAKVINRRRKRTPVFLQIKEEWKTLTEELKRLHQEYDARN